MALIGSIAINMSVRTAQLAKGLKQASSLIAGFDRTARQDFAKGTAMARAGIADIGKGMAAVGAQAARGIAAAALKIKGSLARLAGSKAFAPVKAAALASVDALVFTYGGLGKLLGRAIVRGSGPMIEATRATAGVVQEFYIAPIRKLGGRLFAGIKGRLPSLAPMGRGLGQAAIGVGKVAAGIALIGRGLGKLALAGAARGFRLLGQAAVGTARFLRTATNQLVMFGAKAAAIAGFGLAKVVKLASDLGEQTDRARIQFGDFAGIVIKDADTMAEAFGVSRSKFVGVASAMGGMFEGAGYDAKAAAQLSAHFVKLATDAASFANIPFDVALEKLRSGLSGEMEPMRDLGVDMSEMAVKAKAAQMGLKAMGGTLSQSQKMQARVAIITAGLAKAHGNLAQTANSARNATEGLMGRLSNLAETVGTALLPIVGAAMSELQVGVEALSLAWGDMTAGVVNDQVGVVGAVGETANSMGWLQKSVGFVADAFQTLKIGFYAAQSYITKGSLYIIQGFKNVAQAIDAIAEKLTGARTGLTDYFTVFEEDFSRLLQSQETAVNGMLAAPAASEGVADYFARAQERIKAMRAKATEPGVDVTGLKPNEPLAMAGKGKAAKEEHASALVAGSREAANAVLRSRYGGKGAEDQTAANTKRSADLLAVVAGGVTALVAQRGAASPAMVGGGAVLAGNL